VTLVVPPEAVCPDAETLTTLHVSNWLLTGVRNRSRINADDYIVI